MRSLAPLYGIACLALVAACQSPRIGASTGSQLDECRDDGDCGSGRCLAGYCTCNTGEDCPVQECAPESPTTAPVTTLVDSSETEYDGPAVVAAIHVEQEPLERTIVDFELTDRREATLSLYFANPLFVRILTAHRSLHATLTSGGEGNRRATLLVLRDEQEQMLLATHTGSTHLMETGIFDTPDVAGFTLELSPLCRSRTEDGCFENQVQTEFIGTVSADTSLHLHPWAQSGWMSIEDAPHHVRLWSSGIDGGASRCDTVTEPGRYLHFDVVIDEQAR